MEGWDNDNCINLQPFPPRIHKATETEISKFWKKTNLMTNCPNPEILLIMCIHGIIIYCAIVCVGV